MAKGYEENEQAFGVGDIARLGEFRVKVLEVIQDEDDSYWYEVEPIGFEPPARFKTREVPQSALERI